MVRYQLVPKQNMAEDHFCSSCLNSRPTIVRRQLRLLTSVLLHVCLCNPRSYWMGRAPGNELVYSRRAHRAATVTGLALLRTGAKV